MSSTGVALVHGTRAERIAAAATVPPKAYADLREPLASDLMMDVAALDAEVDALRKSSGADSALPPWDISPVSRWANHPPPPPRDWICEGIALAAGRVCSFIGNGGFGKTMIASQIALAVAATGSLWGMPVSRGSVLGIFCEDEQ